MTKKQHTFSLCVALVVLALSTVAARDANPAPQAVQRQGDQLMVRLARDIDLFQRTLNGPNLQGLANDLALAVDHLADHVARRSMTNADVEDVLRRGWQIDSQLTRQSPGARVQSSWVTVRTDLDQLARRYNVAWNWNDSRYGDPSYRQQPYPQAGLYARLTGTYTLDPSRSDNPTNALNAASRGVSAGQRQGATMGLQRRLQPPTTLAIDRNGRSVTIASSMGPRTTFEANGQPSTETGPRGQQITTRADINGDELVVSTNGDRGSDFSVTFEPLEGGRALRVTRRVYSDAFTQPVVVRSYYRRTAEQASWDIYDPSRGIAGRGADIIPANTQLVARLDRAVSTRNSREGDRFTATVRTGRFAGAVISGTVARVNGMQRNRNRADLFLDFDSVRLSNGRTDAFVGVLDAVRLPDGATLRMNTENRVRDRSTQTETAVERGAVGAAVGAVIGALLGGGKGAAIGAAVGGTGGAGSVFLDDRDELDLPAGTELTITVLGLSLPGAGPQS